MGCEQPQNEVDIFLGECGIQAALQATVDGQRMKTRLSSEAIQSLPLSRCDLEIRI